MILRVITVQGRSRQVGWVDGWQVFSTKLFLPVHYTYYFNTLIGVFFFTLSGFVSAKFLNLIHPLKLAIFTLLIVLAPMVAHNLYFNSNTSTWVSTLLGVIGLVSFYKSSHPSKMLGFILLVIAIGSYQTIVQIAISLVLLKTITVIVAVKAERDLYKTLLTALLMLTLIVCAFSASNMVNHLYIEYNDLAVNYRYKMASSVGSVGSVAIYLDRLAAMQSIDLALLYFKAPLINLYTSIGLLSFLSLLFLLLEKSLNRRLLLLCSLAIISIFSIVPFIVNLPMITGNEIPMRAHYTVAWLVAGAYLLSANSSITAFKTINNKQ
jgi:hypothetical protein